MDVIFPFDAVVVGVGVGSEEFDGFPTSAPPSLSLDTKEVHHACIGAKMNSGYIVHVSSPATSFPMRFRGGHLGLLRSVSPSTPLR